MIASFRWLYYTLGVMVPVRLKPFYPKFAQREFRLLDVGCGDHSASITKRYFPQCRYFGIDREMGTTTLRAISR